MANILRAALTATGQRLTMNIAGMSYFGVGLTGSWAGTVAFRASSDGVNFSSVQLTPWPTGAAVTSATTNVILFTGAENYNFIEATFTRTSGTVIVSMAASIDGSYQNAFLTAATQYPNHTATGATNTMTIAAQANRAWRLRTLTLSNGAAATWASSPALTVSDGSTLLWGYDPPTAQGTWTIPLPADPNTPGVTGGGLVNTPGNTLVVVLASAGGAVVTNLNAEISAA